MKKLILGAILTAGAVLAQSSATAPANSGTKSGTAATGSSSNAKPVVKRHRKSNKPATANANKQATGKSNAAGSNTPAAPANK